MFKYKLKLVKTDDLKEYETFKAVVPALYELTDDIISYIKEGLEISPETAFVLTTLSESLSTMIDIYFENKYSNPSSSMMLYKHLSLFQEHVREIISIFIKCQELKAASDKRRQEFIRNNDDYELEMYEKQLSKILDEGAEIYNKTCIALIEAIRHIKCVIIPDKKRLELGYDVMRAYKKRMKKENKKIKSLSEDNFMNEFSVRFKVLSNSDREFIEKERIKNERNRTRNADGGLSKKV